MPDILDSSTIGVSETYSEPVLPLLHRLFLVFASVITGKSTGIKIAKFWKVKKKFCNKTNQPLKVLVADNPWEPPNPGENMYKYKRYPGDNYDDVMAKAKAAGKTLTLGPKGSGTDCQEIGIYLSI